MKKYLAVFGLLFGIAAVCRAGTPQETFYQGQSPLSGVSIIGSTATPTSIGNYTLTVATPTAVNGVSCRNCFTKFVVQIPTTTVVAIADRDTTVWTIYGLGLGSSGVNTLSLPEDHLGPFCSTAGNKTLITLTNTAGNTVPASFNYEGYVECGGTNNAGSMQ